ncbi:LysM peptidoglycan-binding domain-containing protein [Clostridium sp. YIM B02515]|uniref:LysM peptidoglycan-binding domain-containing protein n=1 Tax=Clostridium rhizosphaerae TaxID=2803861 RepID=A0ABS1T7H9_9CLOT|nr:cell wall hydrolase [Clostridium rhizosphaerae]MBL4935289.1 LysM peptidoglycan-binding domain-containing protein [Clostridium rhizosphaerae]
MINSKNLKVLLFTAAITLFSAHSAKAADYTVSSGDSLYTVGKLFNTNTYTLKGDNRLSSDIIYPGQVLNVRAKDYTVKSGDTLYLIAKNNGISLNFLRKANNYWTDYIYPGQKLIIPGTSYSVNSTSQTHYGVIPYTDSDLDLLARLVHAEAQGEPYKAKAAVAAVVVNRVQSSAWPNTIRDVIYQRINGYYQFSPVLNGMINQAATSEDRQAALDALNGYDPTNGAQFYFDDSTKNTWLWSKPVALRVDNMVFSY